MPRILLCLLPLLAIAASPVIRPLPPDGSPHRVVEPAPLHALISIAVGASLQANAGKALQILENTPLYEPSPIEVDFIDCMRARFGAGKDPPVEARDPFARQVVLLFHEYWHRSLLDPPARPAAEATLAQGLRELLDVKEDLPLGKLEPMVKRQLRQEGFESLMGITYPLRELIVWRKFASRRYHVALPEGEHSVQVAILDDFESLGWADYATCGLRGVGGWANRNVLYAVRPRYRDLKSEEFTVTFLGHETQHLADLARFPDLAAWHLEYRAKLTELALATTTRRGILSKFLEDQGGDAASPHSYANKRVLEALHRRLGDDIDLAGVPAANLQAAAKALLFEDSRRLQ